MICDAHVHVGEFSGGLYFTPEEVADCMRNFAIDKFLFFSTARENNFDLAYNQFLCDSEKLIELSPNSAVPCLWLNLDAFKSIKHYIKSGFKALKFHPKVEKNLTDTDYDYVVSVAEDYSLPLIIHTGYDPHCLAGRIAKICEKHSSAKIILAHGRPFDEAIRAASLENVYIDTAYMPPEEAKKFVKAGYGKKLFFASDYPLDRYFYPSQNANLRYGEYVDEMQKILPDEALYKNFLKFFS